MAMTASGKRFMGGRLQGRSFRHHPIGRRAGGLRPAAGTRRTSEASVVELAGSDGELELVPGAPDQGVHRPPDQLGDHHSLEVGGALDRAPVELEDQVARRGSRPTSAGLSSTTSSTSTAVRCVHGPTPRGAAAAAGRRRLPRIRTPHPAVADQRADDAPRRGVDRHRQPEPDAGDRGVDADHAAATVDERAAGVARG